MDANKIDLFLMTYGKYFSRDRVMAIRHRLETTPDEKFAILQAVSFKEPVLTLVISLLGGSLGIDRFFLGETGLGVAKLLTCGGLGIWTIIDWFIIMDKAREVNDQKINEVLSY
jgi:TM2 domain-containing membrane protein YozV